MQITLPKVLSSFSRGSGGRLSAGPPSTWVSLDQKPEKAIGTRHDFARAVGIASSRGDVRASSEYRSVKYIAVGNRRSSTRRSLVGQSRSRKKSSKTIWL